MPTEKKPFIKHEAGGPITAEDSNAMQVQIKEYVENEIESAKTEIREGSVKQAENAEKFADKTPKNWTDELDQRYAPKVHDHEELAGYRRYFKRLKVDQKVVLEHQLGRFPLVDVYELLPVSSVGANATDQKSTFYLYYHHEERDRDVLFTEDRGMKRWPWGIPLEKILQEYHVQWDDDDTLGDVVNDFLDAFFKPPEVDHMEHRTSIWINDHRKEIISDLKSHDEWPDIRWVVKPHKLIVGRVPGNANIPSEALWWIDVVHLSYDALEVAVTGTDAPGQQPPLVDLMILLRS